MARTAAWVSRTSAVTVDRDLPLLESMSASRNPP
jgi:hypothetical protein